MKKEKNIAVVGLGYVGLSLAVNFGKHLTTYGYDIAEEKVDCVTNRKDTTGQISDADFCAASRLTAGVDPAPIGQADVVIITVPTPVDLAKKPDFRPLLDASKTVGANIKVGCIVVYESTVYPGATEDLCIPELESASGLRWRKDFGVAYSPERINPGDPDHSLSNVKKLVSADESKNLECIYDLYSQIIPAGVVKVDTIKIAEAAKVIENTQRDLNIALMNELSIIFNKLNINTKLVLEAAQTKWNFLPFEPGLVGGHCIGVDPYYLTHRSEMLGYRPEVILAGRRINDGMPAYIAQQITKQFANSEQNLSKPQVLLFGLTFKENCPDLRNSKSYDLWDELNQYGCEVFVHDPFVKASEQVEIYGKSCKKIPINKKMNAIIVAVPHDQYMQMSLTQITRNLKSGGLFVDVKSRFSKKEIIKMNYRYWSL